MSNTINDPLTAGAAYAASAQPFSPLPSGASAPRSLPRRCLSRTAEIARELYHDFQRLSPLRKWQISIAGSCFLGFCFGLIVMAAARPGTAAVVKPEHAHHLSPPPPPHVHPAGPVHPPPPPPPPSSHPHSPPSPSPPPPPHWITEEMLFSPLLKLKPGEILFEAHRALEMPTPNGSYALLGFSDVAVVIACCGQGSDPGEAFCPATNSSGAARHLKVRLRYTVKYTRETWRVTPLQVGVLPAAPHCAEHFAVLRNASRENVRIASNYTMPFAASVKHATAYLRAGAENISLYVNGQRRCASHARYSPLHNVTHEGKNGTNSSKLAGGVLTHATHCVSPEGGPLSLRKGDSLLVEAWYFAGRHDKRLPWSDGTHLNAAAHFFLAFEPDAPISDIGSGEAVAEEDEGGEAALLDAMGPL